MVPGAAPGRSSTCNHVLGSAGGVGAVPPNCSAKPVGFMFGVVTGGGQLRPAYVNRSQYTPEFRVSGAGRLTLTDCTTRSPSVGVRSLARRSVVKVFETV